MEDQLAALQDQLRTREQPMSPGAFSRQAESAAEIDNEMLREQVQHLQKRIATLEDSLEEAQAAAEHEEAAGEGRVRKLVEKEELARKELAEAKVEAEALVQAELRAKDRAVVAEEAMHESALALENARAEIEGLRAELAVGSFSVVLLEETLTRAPFS
jgi:CAP-Gly domain-containing linker protein 1